MEKGENKVNGANFAALAGATFGIASTVFEICKSDGWSAKSVQKGVKKRAKPALMGAYIGFGSLLASS